MFIQVETTKNSEAYVNVAHIISVRQLAKTTITMVDGTEYHTNVPASTIVGQIHGIV